MYLSELHVENYRLLKDVNIKLDRNLTLFVGKNNTGKTSIMQVVEFLLSDSKSLYFNDYPIECRSVLYNAILEYWRDKESDSIKKFLETVPITKIFITIDYSDGILGAVSDFIIDLDESIEKALVQITYEVSPGVTEILSQCKVKYDSLVDDDTDANKRIKCLSRIVKNPLLHVVDIKPLEYLVKRPVPQRFSRQKCAIQQQFHLLQVI